MEPFEYDIIDSNIFKCFIAHKGTNIETDIGRLADYRKVEEKLATICKENGGKYYKSEAKTAKFAIIFNYMRTASMINKLRDKGYKVTSFENMIVHFNLQDIWDTSGMIKKVKKHKEAMMKLL